MVIAWVTANMMIFGQEPNEEKSNEITSIPKLLELLQRHGFIVNIDKMLFQREIAEQIVSQEADYVLRMNGNQSTLMGWFF
jgi:predicted transposase YbfD/YdcC